MAFAADRCPGCGAPLPGDPNGPHHRYMTSSSACWEHFGAVIAREFSQPGWGSEHRLTVDTYASQHPGEDDRKQRQSVAIHLVALCHRVEHHLDAKALLLATQEMTAEKREWPRLDPPRRYPMTVMDVAKAKAAEEHLRLVRDWAATTWSAWAPHHGVIRGWADAALAAIGRA
jgi:Family of unknown function (DUF5946)